MRSGTPRRKNPKFKAAGRHRRPSPARRAARQATRQAGLAVPALAATGALVAGSHALAAAAPHAAPAGPAARPVTARLDAAVRPAARTYTIQPGDTLAGIAKRFYGHASYWRWLYEINKSRIADPNVVFPGQVLSVPVDPPASVRNGTKLARHAKATTATDASAVSATGAVTCSANAGGPLPANYAAIVGFLTAHGYTGLAAAGIAGNIYQESEGNPESVGSGGGGLIGWTPLPAGFVTGNVAADLQTQLEALLTYNQQWAQFIPALNAATSAAEAADIYMDDFERPGIPAAGNREAAADAVAAACGL